MGNASAMTSSLQRILGNAGGRVADEAHGELTSLVASRERALKKAEAAESVPAIVAEDLSHLGGLAIRAGMDYAAEKMGVLKYTDMGAPVVALGTYGAGFLSGYKPVRRAALGFGSIDLYRVLAGKAVAKEHARDAFTAELEELERLQLEDRNDRREARPQAAPQPVREAAKAR